MQSRVSLFCVQSQGGDILVFPVVFSTGRLADFPEKFVFPPPSEIASGTEFIPIGQRLPFLPVAPSLATACAGRRERLKTEKMTTCSEKGGF